MNYTQFKETVSDEIQIRLGSNYSITLQTVERNNGICFDGMTIKNNEFNISPTFYLNKYYHRYLDGVNIEDICDDIIKVYNHKKPQKDFNVSEFLDFNLSRDKIIFKLVNYDRNIELLKNIPHIKFHDMAIVFMYFIENFENGDATILIHNEHLESWNTSLEELHILAKANTPRIRGIKFTHLNNFIGTIISRDHMLPQINDDIPMYILTNNSCTYGASVILYKGILKEIADKLCSNLIILPSSVDEVIIIAIEESFDNSHILDFYSEMVREVNETSVADDSILSNRAYLYNYSTDEIL